MDGMVDQRRIDVILFEVIYHFILFISEEHFKIFV